MPYRRSQEGLPSPGVRVGHWARAGCSEKDLRQAQGLRAKADWAQGTEEGGTRKILWGSLAQGGYLTLWGCPGEGPQAPQGLHSSPWKGAGEPVVQIYGPLSSGGRLFLEGAPGFAPSTALAATAVLSTAASRKSVGRARHPQSGPTWSASQT